MNNLLFQKQSHTAHEGDGEMLLDEQGHDVLLHLLLYLPPDEALDLVLDHPDDPLGVLLGFQAGRNHHVYLSRSWNGLFVCSNVFVSQAVFSEDPVGVLFSKVFISGLFSGTG